MSAGSGRGASTSKLTGYDQLAGAQLLIAVAGILLGNLLSALDSTIVSAAMPRIIADLGGMSHYAWVATAYLLGSTAAVPIFGKLSDLYGRKWFYVGGLILFMATSALCGLAQSMIQLVIFRGLQGIAGGILAANAFAIIGDLFPPAERGKWQGVTASVFGLASVVGPALGGFLTDGPGWRWVFYVNLPIGLIAVAVTFFGLPAIRTREPGPVDYLGAATLVGFTVPLLLALSWGGSEYDWGSPQVLGMFALFVAMLVAFIVVEHRAAEPIIAPRFFRDRTFVVSVVSICMVGAAMVGTVTYMPLFVQGVLGASATGSGAIVMPMMLSFVIASTIGGQIISRIGRFKWASVAGIVLTSVALWLMTRIDINTDNTIVIRNLVVLGVGLGLAMPTFTLAVQSVFPRRDLGAVTSGVQFFRSIGSTVGVAAMGAFLTSTLSRELARDLSGSTAAALPADVVANLNPQVLASPEAARAMQTELAGLPNGAALFNELVEALRLALSVAIHNVFLVAALASIVAVITVLFLPETRLRRRDDPAAVAETAFALAEDVLAPSELAPDEEPVLPAAKPAVSGRPATTGAGAGGSPSMAGRLGD